jgi:hypothetical protein
MGGDVDDGNQASPMLAAEAESTDTAAIPAKKFAHRFCDYSE